MCYVPATIVLPKTIFANNVEMNNKGIYAATTHNTRLEMKRAKRDDVGY